MQLHYISDSDSSLIGFKILCISIFRASHPKDRNGAAFMYFRLNINYLAAAFVASYFLSRFFFKPTIILKSQLTPTKGTSSTQYKGTTWRSDRTVSVRTVAETSFARCDVHTVVSEDGRNVFKDWIFLEEVNAVNIVVQTAEGKFVVFKQHKYAVPGETFSPVGGFVDDGEHPWTSAKREVLEELGLGSKFTFERVNKNLSSRDDRFRKDPNRLRNVVTDIVLHDMIPPKLDEFGIPQGQIPNSDDPDWIFLGRYRTAVNRGG